MSLGVRVGEGNLDTPRQNHTANYRDTHEQDTTNYKYNTGRFQEMHDTILYNIANHMRYIYHAIAQCYTQVMHNMHIIITITVIIACIVILHNKLRYILMEGLI